MQNDYRVLTEIEERELSNSFEDALGRDKTSIKKEMGEEGLKEIRRIEKLYDDDLFIELVPHARAMDSMILELCLQVLNSHNIPALLAIGNAIHLVRYHGRTLYAKVKSGR